VALDENAVGGCKAFGQCFAWDRAVRKAILKCEKEGKRTNVFAGGRHCGDRDGVVLSRYGVERTGDEMSGDGGALTIKSCDIAAEY